MPTPASSTGWWSACAPAPAGPPSWTGRPGARAAPDAGRSRAAGGGEIGKVEHVLADADADIFDGLVIDMRTGPGGHRFVDAPHVAAIDADGVTLTLGEREAERLPEPTDNPATMSADPSDTAPDDL